MLTLINVNHRHVYPMFRRQRGIMMINKSLFGVAYSSDKAAGHSQIRHNVRPPSDKLVTSPSNYSYKHHKP